MIAKLKGHPAEAALKEYGISEQYELDKAIGYKHSGSGHYYLALYYKDGNIVDLAAPAYEGPWEVQNDGHDLVTPAQWKKLFIPDQCDCLDGWPSAYDV